MTKTLVNTQSEVTAAPTKLGGSAGVAVSSLNSWDEEFEQDDKFTLARLVLNHVDPVATLRSRRAQIADDKVFNVNLKGVSDKDEGKYPGPRVNQKSSGRCWLFAASEYMTVGVGRLVHATSGKCGGADPHPQRMSSVTMSSNSSSLAISNCPRATSTSTTSSKRQTITSSELDSSTQ